MVIFIQQRGVQKQEMDDLGKNDFLLGIQTRFQRDMMRQFGSDVICLDATHDTNIYDLISVLVVDEFGEGIPVAWAISNKEMDVY